MSLHLFLKISASYASHSKDTPDTSSGSTSDKSLAQGSSTILSNGDADKEKGFKNGDGSEQYVKGEGGNFSESLL